MNKERVKQMSKDQIIGQEVLTIDNAGKIGQGILTGFETKHELPAIETPSGKYFCMGVILPYSTEVRDFIHKTDVDKRWKIFSGITSFMVNLEYATKL